MSGALASNQLTVVAMQLERFPNTTARAVARLDYLARAPGVYDNHEK